MNMMDKWRNRRNLEYQLKNHFNCNYAYQKLGDKQTLKHIRTDKWLKTSRLIRTVYNACWDARYDLKKGDV